MRQPLTNPRTLDREDEWPHYPGARKSSTSNPSKKSSFIRLYQKPNQGAQSFPHADYIKTTFKKKKKGYKIESWKMPKFWLNLPCGIGYLPAPCSDAPWSSLSIQHAFCTTPYLSKAQFSLEKDEKDKKENFEQPDWCGRGPLLDDQGGHSLSNISPEYFFKFRITIFRILFRNVNYLLVVLFQFSHTCVLPCPHMRAGCRRDAPVTHRPCCGQHFQPLQLLFSPGWAFGAQILPEVNNSARSGCFSTVSRPWNTKSSPNFPLNA